MEAMVKIRLFKDHGEYRDPVFAAVNGRTYLIQRGEEVRGSHMRRGGVGKLHAAAAGGGRAYPPGERRGRGMTAAEAIAAVDELLPTRFRRRRSGGGCTRWKLSRRRIFHTTVSPFSEAGSEPLLAPAAYADLYLKFLEAQMHFHNGDFARYNNAMSLFSSLYAACAASRTRAELPDAGARVRL